jgi:predicted ester cyclase
MKKAKFSFPRSLLFGAFFLLVMAFGCQLPPQEEGLTEERAKIIFDGVLGAYNEGNLALLEEVCDSVYVRHDCAYPDDFVGIDAYKGYVEYMRTAYPDFNLKLNELIVKGDWLIIHWTVTGTNTGLRGDVPPTGKGIEISGISLARVIDGKMIEEWNYYNLWVTYEQMGFTLVPPQEQVEEEPAI